MRQQLTQVGRIISLHQTEYGFALLCWHVRQHVRGIVWGHFLDQAGERLVVEFRGQIQARRRVHIRQGLSGQGFSQSPQTPQLVLVVEQAEDRCQVS